MATNAPSGLHHVGRERVVTERHVLGVDVAPQRGRGPHCGGVLLRLGIEDVVEPIGVAAQVHERLAAVDERVDRGEEPGGDGVDGESRSERQLAIDHLECSHRQQHERSRRAHETGCRLEECEEVASRRGGRELVAVDVGEARYRPRFGPRRLERSDAREELHAEALRLGLGP
jgi:hypothetical protein